jgi:hypothetical protein
MNRDPELLVAEIENTNYELEKYNNSLLQMLRKADTKNCG